MWNIIGAFNWSNPWLINIATAVISGLVVNWVSRFFFYRKDDKELRQRIDNANSEVIYALRPSISEGSMPNTDIIEALVQATARKYALKRENLLSQSEYADELIKQVMDSNFISHAQKVKYCSAISKIKNEYRPKKETAKGLLRWGTADPYYVYRQKLVTRQIYAVSIMSFVLVLVATALYIEPDYVSLMKILGVVVGSAATILVIITAYSYYSKFEHRKRHESLARIYRDNKTTSQYVYELKKKTKK